MAEAIQATLDGSPSGAGEKLRRQYYSREKKLEVIAFYQANNLYQTARKFSLNAYHKRTLPYKRIDPYYLAL